MSRKAIKWVNPEDRQSHLISARNLKMARSVHAYVRGNTIKFYEWLENFSGNRLPTGPAIWICGDCHLGNLGPLADADGRVAVQIRDLDQTVIGNPAHDLVRLGLSLAMSARGSDLPGVITAKMLEQLIEGYRQTFMPETDLKAKLEKPDAVRIVMKQALQRSWKHLAKERLDGAGLDIPLGKRFWPLTEAEKKAVKSLFEESAVASLVTSVRARNDNAPVRVVDAAYWKKGCSSLGLLRLAVLVEYGDDSGGTGNVCLIDIKEAVRTAAPFAADAVMPRDNAERIVEGARHLAPNLGDRMVATRLLDRSVFLREVLPQDLKLEIKKLTFVEAMRAAKFLGMSVGKAHAAQMDERTRKSWHGELLRNRTKTLDAPSWLWSAVVDLITSHEGAYLEHCRKYAMHQD
ncbi:MAG TPA: DUF2252 family protein [Burkholderiales bacterium]|nr:DUF2252 family protein [Burkholderiales bacterium]